MSEGEKRRAQILEILRESEQPVSGTDLAGRLHVSRQFVARMKDCGAHPLKMLTDGWHYHTLTAPSEEHLDLLEAELRKKHYL